MQPESRQAGSTQKLEEINQQIHAWTLGARRLEPIHSLHHCHLPSICAIHPSLPTQRLEPLLRQPSVDIVPTKPSGLIQSGVRPDTSFHHHSSAKDHPFLLAAHDGASISATTATPIGPVCLHFTSFPVFISILLR